MSRGCPRCAAELQPRMNGGTEVDVCPICGGIYLDEGEFDTIIAERYEGKKTESMFGLIGEEVDDPLYCSDCNAAMHRVDYDEVELDRCPDCGSIWLDAHEHSDFVDRARESERDPDIDAIVICSGCGQSELQRLCIKRMDAYWCEDCVVAGNHPGPEAELARAKKAKLDALSAQMHMERRREEAKDRMAGRKYGHRRYGRDALYYQGFLDLVEMTARKITNLFRHEPKKPE